MGSLLPPSFIDRVVWFSPSWSIEFQRSPEFPGTFPWPSFSRFFEMTSPSKRSLPIPTQYLSEVLFSCLCRPETEALALPFILFSSLDDSSRLLKSLSLARVSFVAPPLSSRAQFVFPFAELTMSVVSFPHQIFSSGMFPSSLSFAPSFFCPVS